MSDSWGILNGTLLWPATLAALLLFVLFAFKEWQARRGNGFYLRLVLGACAIAALLGLALKPAVMQELQQRKAILLTPGFDQVAVDSLKRANPGIRILEYLPGRHLDLDPALSEVLILGHGLASYDLWQAEGRNAAFLPAAPPAGITRLHHTRDVALGSGISIEGVYSKPVRGHRLLLRDPGGNPRDSAVMPQGLQWPFRLQAVPKAPGNLTYLLEEQDSSGQVIRTDPVPVRVQPPAPMRVLILNTFPTFETRYLKNLLAEKGNEVVVRSQLTRGAYKFEYFNRSKQPIYQLNAENLGEFDLLITDVPSYRSLGTASRTALRKSMEDSGLGLLVQVDERYFNLPEKEAFFSFRQDGQTTWDAGYGKGLVLEKFPYAFSMEFPTEPIMLPNGKMVGAYRPMGKGRVATTLLKDTYQWVLQGKDEAYRELWAALLSQAAASLERPVTWEGKTLLPRPDEPFDFIMRGELTGKDTKNEIGLRLPLIQDLLIPTLWKGTDYPEGPGWNHLRLPSDSLSVFPYYVYEPGDWKALGIRETREANQRHFQGSMGTETAVEGLLPVSPVWFYALFLASMGWLWLEPRLRDS